MNRLAHWIGRLHGGQLVMLMLIFAGMAWGVHWLENYLDEQVRIRAEHLADRVAPGIFAHESRKLTFRDSVARAVGDRLAGARNSPGYRARVADVAREAVLDEVTRTTLAALAVKRDSVLVANIVPSNGVFALAMIGTFLEVFCALSVPITLWIWFGAHRKPSELTP